jgi:hypothetical protein
MINGYLSTLTVTAYVSIYAEVPLGCSVWASRSLRQEFFLRNPGTKRRFKKVSDWKREVCSCRKYDLFVLFCSTFVDIIKFQNREVKVKCNKTFRLYVTSSHHSTYILYTYSTIYACLCS